MSAKPGRARGGSLRERALRLLARRDYTRAELRTRLLAPPRGARRHEITEGDPAGFASPADEDLGSTPDATGADTGSSAQAPVAEPAAESVDDAVDALLDHLQQSGLLSDARYANQRAGGRGQRLGNTRLAHELRTKGVDDAIIAEALQAAGDEAARARAVWQRKFGTAPTSREAWAKQARFLQSRGFSSAIIRALMRDCANAEECTGPEDA